MQMHWDNMHDSWTENFVNYFLFINLFLEKLNKLIASSHV